MTPWISQPLQPSSVNYILRQHSNGRLYLHPLLWTTNNQPTFLNTRFVRSQPVTSAPEKSIQDTKVRKAALNFIFSKEMTFKQWRLTDLLESLSKDREITSRDSLDFFFGDRPVAELRSHIFYSTINGIRTPFLAYIDSSEIARLRQKSICMKECSLLAWRIRNATLAKLQPRNIAQDPYIVGVLIALGQARARSNNTIDSQSSFSVHICSGLKLANILIKEQVHLLLTNCDKPGFVRLYTAKITAAFLRKLDQPSIFSDSSLDIQKVPILSVSYLEHEIAAIVESPRGKKHLRESSPYSHESSKRRKKCREISVEEGIPHT